MHPSAVECAPAIQAASGTTQPANVRLAKKVCAVHCEVCTSNQVGDCSLCSNGYFAHPFTSACDSMCTPGYYPDVTTRKCLLCSPSCATCSGPGDSACSSCGTNLSLIGSQCFCSNSLPYDGVSCDCFDLSPDVECSNCGNEVLDPGEDCED